MYVYSMSSIQFGVEWRCFTGNDDKLTESLVSAIINFVVHGINLIIVSIRARIKLLESTKEDV